MRNKAKIIVWEGLSHIAGGQRVLLNILSYLKEKFDFKAIIPKKGMLFLSLKKLDIPVHFIPVGTYHLGKKGLIDILKFVFLTPLVLFKALKIVRNSDLIYANCNRIFIWSVIIGILVKKPVIWHLHSLFTDKKTKFLIEFFGKSKTVKKIIAVSESAKNQFPKLKNKFEVVYNGVDISKFQPLVNQKNLKQKNIGIIADLVPQKGHKTLIKAFNLIKEKNFFKLFIVGKPRDNTQWYEKELKNLVNKLKLNENIEFLGYCQDIPKILNKLDLLVVPSSSLFEACPMVILEAFACGVSVIGSNLGGTLELIEEGKTGFIFEANNEYDLAKKILLILNNSKLQREMKKNCRKIAEKKFDLKISMAKIEKNLTNLVYENSSNK